MKKVLKYGLFFFVVMMLAKGLGAASGWLAWQQQNPDKRVNLTQTNTGDLKFVVVPAKGK